jgi:hypothetical protein
VHDDENKVRVEVLGLGRGKVGVLSVLGEHLLEHRLISSLRHGNLLVNHSEDTTAFRLKQLERRHVVFELNEADRDALRCVLL